MGSSRPGRPVLRDAATLCLAVFRLPSSFLLCELDRGHLDKGEKHKSRCTRWGRVAVDQPQED